MRSEGKYVGIYLESRMLFGNTACIKSIRNCHAVPESSRTAVLYAGYLDRQLLVMETLGYLHVSWLVL